MCAFRVWCVVRCCMVCLYSVICLVFLCACLSVCFVCNRLCDVAWCFACCCLLCGCVFRSYHVKYVFVCFGDSLRDGVDHVLCACV